MDERDGPMLLEANARPGLAIQMANGLGLGQALNRIDAGLESEGAWRVDAAKSLAGPHW